MKQKLFSLSLLLAAFCFAGCGDNCGNGTLETEDGEQCDDGNNLDGDGCSATCEQETTNTNPTPTPSTQTPVCGNGIVESGEQCEDGNTVSGDGCSSTCQKESTPTPTQTPVCGNGIKESGEQCDDGNTKSGDGCSSSCKKESSSSTPEPTSNCPNDGDECTESICCDGYLYDCKNGAYEGYECHNGYVCDTYDKVTTCYESCTSEDAEYEFYKYYCEESEVVYLICDKNDSDNNYIGIEYIATSLCIDTDLLATCKGASADEVECSSECIETEDYKDYCE